MELPQAPEIPDFVFTSITLPEVHINTPPLLIGPCICACEKHEPGVIVQNYQHCQQCWAWKPLLGGE